VPHSAISKQSYGEYLLCEKRVVCDALLDTLLLITVVECMKALLYHRDGTYERVVVGLANRLLMLACRELLRGTPGRVVFTLHYNSIHT
jgi:hypothetical protein